MKPDSAMRIRRKVGGKDDKPDFAEETYHLVYHSFEIQPKFRSNMSSPSSEFEE